MRGHAVVGVERVEQGAQDTALWGSYVQGDGVGGELADFHHLRSAGEEILNPVTEWSGYVEVWEFNSQLDGDYNIESWAIVNENELIEWIVNQWIVCSKGCVASNTSAFCRSFVHFMLTNWNLFVNCNLSSGQICSWLEPEIKCGTQTIQQFTYKLN